jgi:hypothetical protein
MVQVLEQDVAADAINATINYTVDTGEKIVTLAAAPGASDVRNSTPDPRRVTMHNGRPEATRFELERDGFRFVRHDTKVADFFDQEQIRRVYYPEMEALVNAESGASRVVIFDHTLRTADGDEREARKIREVVQRAHNDYTEWSGPQRVRDLLPEEADELLRRRFAIIQVWRPIRHPVETFPLALCDARSVAFEDFVISERRYPNRIGQTYISSTIPITAGTTSRACGARRRWCSRSMTRSTTAARAGPRTLRSRIRPLRPMQGRAKASRSVCWRFSDRQGDDSYRASSQFVWPQRACAR